MGGFLDRIKDWWANSSPTQRYTTLGGIALTVMLLVGVFSVSSRPSYAMLYGGLSQTDQAAIVSEIQTQGIPVKYDIPGQVEIPADKVAEVRMRLATSGKVPKSAHMGMANLADMNLYTTPAVERERLKAIAEGELAQSIETHPGVRSARVHITLGDPSPFGDQQRPPTASISLITSGAGSVSREQARGIALMVANSVDGLDMKSVAVLDEKAETLFNGNEMQGGDSVASRKLEMEGSYARKEEQRLQARLDKIFGTGATEVSVHAEVNMDEIREKKNEHKVVMGKTPLKSMTEKMGDVNKDGGAAGLVANGGDTSAPATVDGKKGDGYISETKMFEPSRTEIETTTNKSIGSVKSVLINVAANTSVFADEESLTAVRTFVANEIANHPGDQKFKASVVPMAFDVKAKTQVESAQSDAASAARMQQILSMLPIAALVVVGVLVMKQLGKVTRTTIVPTTALATAGGPTYGYSQGGMASISPVIVEELKNLGLEPGTEAYQAIAATIEANTPAMNEADENGIIYRDSSDVMEVQKIREKKSSHLIALQQMAKERPEPTAMLIKTWLSEETK
jgi:flagellar M-ring protein FliF